MGAPTVSGRYTSRRTARRARRWWVRGALCLGAAVALAAAYVARVGGALPPASPLPPELDVVFTFAGNRARALWSSELAERYAARWLICVDPSDPSVADDPVYEGAELLPERHSTYDEAVALRDRLELGPATAVVGLVTDAYHIGRAELTSRRVFAGTAYRLVYLPVPDRLDPVGWRERMSKRWWLDRALRREAFKRLYYALYGYLLPFGRTE